jgi:superfamily II DNA or RNA helicase
MITGGLPASRLGFEPSTRRFDSYTRPDSPLCGSAGRPSTGSSHENSRPSMRSGQYAYRSQASGALAHTGLDRVLFSRNRRIVDDVIAAIHEGRSPILLTERKDHLEYFAEQLRGFVRHLIVLQGGMTAKERSRSASQLASIPDTAEWPVLATGRYIGEGFDDPRLDTLFLAEMHVDPVQRPPSSKSSGQNRSPDL